MAYIILRARKVLAERGFAVPVSSLRISPADVEVEVADLSTRELAGIRRDRLVLEVAPPLPVQLIQPLAIDAEYGVSAARRSPMPVRLTKPVSGSSGKRRQVTRVSWGIEAVGASGSKFTGSGVTVAVLDTGIDKKHPAFAGIELTPKNFKNFTKEGGRDLHGHGTHCAGTIFGRSVEGTRIGVAPGVRRALIGKVLNRRGGGSTDAIYRAILWAINEKAQVISLSLGIDFPGYVRQLMEEGCPAELATSRALDGYRANIRLYDAVASVNEAQEGIGSGAILVAAAGNESRRRTDPKYKIAVGPPAAAEDFISVAAVQPAGKGAGHYQIADFSNTHAKIAAPGVDIWSAERGGGLIAMSGTSMAAPHVAGVAALWIERSLRETGRFKASEVVARVLGNAKLTPGLNANDVGVGVVRAP